MNEMGCPVTVLSPAYLKSHYPDLVCPILYYFQPKSIPERNLNWDQKYNEFQVSPNLDRDELLLALCDHPKDRTTEGDRDSCIKLYDAIKVYIHLTEWTNDVEPGRQWLLRSSDVPLSSAPGMSRPPCRIFAVTSEFESAR